MTKTTKLVSASQPENYEAASVELENIVAKMEAGQMPLEDSLAAYKRGIELLQYCQNTLQTAQQQVRILETDMLKNFSTSGIDER